MKNILVPIDFSAVQQNLVSVASALAGPLNAKLWLVHVAAPDPDFVGFRVGPEYVREQRADILRQEHKEIQAMAASLKASALDAEALLVQGPTTDTILEVAQNVSADLIVIGSHGRSALFRAFVGSVSEQVLKDSKIPVLVVPTPGKHG